MKKVFLLFVLFTILFVSGFSAFAKGENDTESKSVKIWVGGQVSELGDSWDAIIKNFEKETGITVNSQLIGFDSYYDRLVTALEGESGPDVAFADLGGWVPTFAAQGWLTSLENTLHEWEGTPQIWDNLWETVSYKGKRYAVPWYTDDRLLLYNKTLFEQAGLDPNTPPKTWKELMKTAKKITNISKGIYGYGISGTQTEHTTLGYLVFLHENSGMLLTDDYSKAAFNTSAGLEALKMYVALAPYSPNPISHNEDDYRNLMAQNRIAMAIGGPWSFPLIEKANPAIAGNYSVAPHPYNTHVSSVLGGWGLIIPKASKHKEFAIRLIQYLASKKTWLYFLEQNGGPMPARKDAANESPRLQNDTKWKTVIDVYPTAIPRPPIPKYPQVSLEIQKMVQNVLLDEMNPEEAIDIAEKNVNTILNR